MYEELIIHARTEEGEALCGKKELTADEVLQGPYWDGVNCPGCNKRRVLIKTPEDLNYVNQILKGF
jgi:hypothetical protein